MPLLPIRISGRWKGKQSAVQHISTKELDESDDDNAQTNPKSSIFDKLQSPSVEKCPSVFTRFRESKDRKVSESKMVRDQSLRSLQESKLLKSLWIHAFSKRKAQHLVD